TRMTTDVTNMQMAFQMSLRIAVRAPLMLVCSMVMCFVINAELSMIFLVALVILGCALVFIMSRTFKLFEQVFRRYDALNASVQENVSGIRVVKAYVREEHEDEKFRHAAEELRRLFTKAEGILALNSPVMMFVVYGCIIALSWFGANMISVGGMTTGNLTSMFSYVMGVLMSLMMLSMVFVMITMSAASERRISEVLNEKPDLTEPDDPIMDIPDGSIDFDHVSFSYAHGDGEETLHDIDLHIKSGETIGIIGGTGSGKSSLVSLVSRLYDVDSGEVRVGGIDVRRYDIESLRDAVAVVLQKNVLFSGTILDNLRWGKEDATLEECKAVCKMACADEFIDAFPNGYDTWIEQGGTNVSGGQKQRLCIARALLKEPKILILDDSTSAVDTATDASIREAFATKIPGTTKLIIAQRITSVMDADRILVLDDGGVSGFDTHEKLLETNEIYRNIYETQTQGGGDFDEGKEGGN
ncbi:MAG TPA: ABC transporter ATP-binding protein/permease, partial [Firmicutes bacterium]|nr:ABC transporter ATP-binding protein/permease [Bacillota bacterium]